MIIRKLKILIILVTTITAIAVAGCNSIDDDRIPSLPVNINLADIGIWNTYGVSGFGIHTDFILTGNIRTPSGFPYTAASATGFGGVLLIGGMDPFSNETNIPLAYDLACPVECRQDVRVAIDESTLEAVCPVCESHYDVTMAGGAPTAGPALTGKYKYGLRRYSCLTASAGGYIITN